MESLGTGFSPYFGTALSLPLTPGEVKRPKLASAGWLSAGQEELLITN
jgi:hypothetical protein